jgi:hypothetical protein
VLFAPHAPVNLVYAALMFLATNVSQIFSQAASASTEEELTR